MFTTQIYIVSKTGSDRPVRPGTGRCTGLNFILDRPCIWTGENRLKPDRTGDSAGFGINPV